MGLEAALIGKPVIMLGDSPLRFYSSVSRIREITDLPSLIRKKLAESSPSRAQILDAYASFLAPYLPASYNDWRLQLSDDEIDHYVALFDALRQYLQAAQLPAPSNLPAA